MTTFPIKTFTGSIQNQPTRDLHQFLQVGKDFSNWIKDRIANYGFQEGLDFSPISGKTCSPNLVSGENKGLSGVFAKFGENLGGRPKLEYHITLDMAKELCMLERSELGQQARRYFIRMEKEALAARQALPTTTVAANAVHISKDRYIELLENENQLLRNQPNPQRKKAPVPLSVVEKQRILTLHTQGLGKAEIAAQLNRSRSAVRAVIRENQGK